MAPQRKNAAANNDDARSESGATGREKMPANTGAGVGKSRKNHNQGSGLRDVTNVSALGNGKEELAGGGGGGGGGTGAGAGGTGGANGQGVEAGEAIRFPELPRHILHSYRNAHHLPVPSSFSSIVNQAVLSDPNSIGLLSPTMNRPREKRRVSKEVLARAVRRDFMDQSVNELDVEASACYIIRNGDRAFRMRFVQPYTKK